jgi:hypothetical protein
MDHPSPPICFTTTRTGRYVDWVRNLPNRRALRELMRRLTAWRSQGPGGRHVSVARRILAGLIPASGFGRDGPT